MSHREPFVLALPFAGRWLVQNSPATRVPSHGTELFGSSHAIDFVPVDADGRSARRGLRSVFGSERPEEFVGFGRAILAPVTGEVVRVHDGEEDHVARRSIGALCDSAGGPRRASGEQIGECGNSGNSTEPHLHLQVSESIDRHGRGVPLAFRRADELPWVPGNGEIIGA